MRNPLQGKPITQGVIASAIVQIGWNGASAVIGYITGNVALRSLPPWLALLVGAIVFFLLALSYYLFFGRRVREHDRLSKSELCEKDQPQLNLESNLTFEIALRDSQVKFTGGGSHVRRFQADIKLRCIKTSDGVIGVRDFHLSLHRGFDDGGEATVAQEHFKRVLEFPTMTVVSIDDGWTIREPISSYRWFMFLFEITPATQAMLSNDFFLRLTMDAVGQQIISQDIRVESWQDARTSNSSISLRPPPPQLEHELVESQRRATEWKKKYYDAHNAAIPIKTLNENYENRLKEADARMTALTEDLAEANRKFANANSGKLAAINERDALQNRVSELTVRLGTAEANHTLKIEELNSKLGAKIEEVKTAKREAETASLRAESEAQDKRFIRELKERAETQLNDLKWLEARMKEQGAELDKWVRIKKANAVRLHLTTIPRMVIIAFWVRNESLFNVTLDLQNIKGCLHYKNRLLRDPVRLATRTSPREEFEPKAYTEIILEQPLLQSEAETILAGREGHDPNGIFWLGNLHIPILVENVPQKIKSDQKLAIYSEIEHMHVDDFRMKDNV